MKIIDKTIKEIKREYESNPEMFIASIFSFIVISALLSYGIVGFLTESTHFDKLCAEDISQSICEKNQ